MNQRYRVVLLVSLSVFWLAPLFAFALLGHLPTLVPTRLVQQYSAGGLFLQRSSVWTQMSIQLRRQGSQQWESVETSKLSPMGAFGYRQRLDRILQEISSRGQNPGTADTMARLALWIAAADRASENGRREILAVRFGQTVWAANSPALTHPEGHWMAARSKGLPMISFTPLLTFSIKEGEARMVYPIDSNQAVKLGQRSSPEGLPSSIGRRFRPADSMQGTANGTPSTPLYPKSRLP